MAKESTELKEKLLKAQSVDEVKTIISENGETITDSEAEGLYKKIKEQDPNFSAELSVEELDAVSGGKTRDYKTEGCAATVELGSRCWGTDGNCPLFNIDYKHRPVRKCPKCGGMMVVEDADTDKCIKCGYEYGAGFFH